MKTYKEAVNLLGQRESKKIGNNTYLKKLEGGNIGVKLHDTFVVTYTPNNSVILNSGGWKTVTTKARINEYTDVRLSQKNSLWTIGGHMFTDGMEVFENGKIKGAEKVTEKKEKAFQKEKKRLRAYAEKFAHAVINGEVKKPSGGDCWYCCLKTENGKTLVESFKDISHIEGHIKENYFVPSMLYNALELLGSSQYTKGIMGEIWAGLPLEDSPKKHLFNDVKKYIYKYLLRAYSIA
jgi:hypothetical protein